MALLVILTAIRAADYFLVRLLRPDVFTGDLCQHVWWMARFADPSLFPHDFIADFFSHPRIAPYAYQLIYRVLVPFVDPQVVAEIIPFVLGVAVVGLAFALGRRAAGGTFLGGAVAVLLTLFWEPLLYAVQSGLERAFALPLVMLGTWAVMTRRHRWLGVAMLVGALIYPTVVLTLVAFAAAVFAQRWWREGRAPAEWRGTLVFGVAAALVLVIVYGRPLPPDIGPRVTAEQARQMPEFSRAGRSPIFYPSPAMFYFLSGSAGVGFEPVSFVTVTLVMLASVIAFRGLLSFEAWALAGTSFALYFAAHRLLFALYMPNRYVKYSLPVVVLLWLAALVPRVLDEREGWRPAVRASRRLSERPWLVTSILAVAVLAYGADATRRIAVRLHEPPSAGREGAYRFLASLPKDTVIAAHPRDANDLPLRTRRSVLASTETSLSLLLGYYGRVAERIRAELAATYAVSFDDVDALHARYGADVFLVNRERYKPEQRTYYAPFKTDVEEWFDRGRELGFALLAPPKDRVLFEDGNYMVVRLGEGKPFAAEAPRHGGSRPK